MSSYDSIHKKVSLSLSQSGAATQLDSAKPNPARYISPTVAHELNNIITVVQGYADCMLIKHRDNEMLKPQLKSISDAAKRAAIIVRDATPPEASRTHRQSPQLHGSRLPT